jgi:hypothetical protein
MMPSLRRRLHEHQWQTGYQFTFSHFRNTLEVIAAAPDPVKRGRALAALIGVMTRLTDFIEPVKDQNRGTACKTKIC